MIDKDWSIQIEDVTLGGGQLFLIAGPCVIESEQLCVDVAGRVAEIAGRIGMPFIFKSSFDKANRSSAESERGPGLERGLKILAVTVLTSLDASDIQELGYECSIEQLVMFRAKKALESGCDGVVASGREAKAIAGLAGGN